MRASKQRCESLQQHPAPSVGKDCFLTPQLHTLCFGKVLEGDSMYVCVPVYVDMWVPGQHCPALAWCRF